MIRLLLFGTKVPLTIADMDEFRRLNALQVCVLLEAVERFEDMGAGGGPQYDVVALCREIRSSRAHCPHQTRDKQLLITHFVSFDPYSNGTKKEGELQRG